MTSKPFSLKALARGNRKLYNTQSQCVTISTFTLDHLTAFAQQYPSFLRVRNTMFPKDLLLDQG
jgi:hypothetical protein